MQIEGVVQRTNSVGVHGLSDEELIFLSLQHDKHAMVNGQTVDLPERRESARFELSRRQTAQMTLAVEAQAKSARRLACATWGLVAVTACLVLATGGLVAASVYH